MVPVRPLAPLTLDARVDETEVGRELGLDMSLDEILHNIRVIHEYVKLNLPCCLIKFVRIQSVLGLCEDVDVRDHQFLSRVSTSRVV